MIDCSITIQTRHLAVSDPIDCLSQQHWVHLYTLDMTISDRVFDKQPTNQSNNHNETCDFLDKVHCWLIDWFHSLTDKLNMSMAVHWFAQEMLVCMSSHVVACHVEWLIDRLLHQHHQARSSHQLTRLQSHTKRQSEWAKGLWWIQVYVSVVQRLT